MTKNKIAAKALMERLLRERNEVYAMQLAKWHAAKNPFEAWKKWKSKGETMARSEACTALATQEAVYGATR